MRIALRFLALGALLFVLVPSSHPREAGHGAAAIPSDDEALFAGAAMSLGLSAHDPVIARRLIRNAAFLGAADAAAALRDAAALGLAERDLVVQRRLASRLRLAIEAGARAAEPSDDELRAWIVAHPERVAVPARVQVTQIFFSRARRGATLAAAARRARARLRAGGAVAGDPLPLRTALPPMSAAALASLLGDRVARAAFATPIGEWSAPVPSPYGIHLLRVESRQAARLPTLDEVRTAAREGLLAERAAAAVAAARRQLRTGG